MNYSIVSSIHHTHIHVYRLSWKAAVLARSAITGSQCANILCFLYIMEYFNQHSSCQFFSHFREFLLKTYSLEALLRKFCSNFSLTSILHLLRDMKLYMFMGHNVIFRYMYALYKVQSGKNLSSSKYLWKKYSKYIASRFFRNT